MPRSSPPALSPAILQQCTLDIIVGGCGRGNLWLNSRIGQVARCNFSAYWPISFILHHPCFPLGRNGHKFAVLLCGSVKWSISQVAYGPSLALSKIAFLVWLGWLQLTLGIKSSQLTSLHQNLTEKTTGDHAPNEILVGCHWFGAMGIPDEMLVDPRQVAEGLRCVICTEVFVEPVGSGHSTLLDVKGDLMERPQTLFRKVF